VKASITERELNDFSHPDVVVENVGTGSGHSAGDRDHRIGCSRNHDGEDAEGLQAAGIAVPRGIVARRTKCSICKTAERRAGQRTCKACHAEKQKQYRRDRKEYVAKLEQRVREMATA
jgi:hypothetical protein